MRRIFDGWWRSEHWWVAAPLAAWILAVLAWGIIRMIRTRRLMSPHGTVRGLGRGWAATFAAAVVWLVGWSIWLTLTEPTD